MVTSSAVQLPAQIALAASKGSVDGVQDYISTTAGSDGALSVATESRPAGVGGASVLATTAAAAAVATPVTAVGPSSAVATEAAITEELPGSKDRATVAFVGSASSQDSAEEGAASPPLKGGSFPPEVEVESSHREGDPSSSPGSGESAIRGDELVHLKAVGSGDGGGGSAVDGAVARRPAHSPVVDEAPSSSPSPPSLSEWLKQGPYVLAMAPGFFGFYGHIGALVALGDADLLERRVSFATGASAGGLIAGLFAAGLSPRDMSKIVVKFRRPDFWDPVGFGGVLRGQKFEALIKTALPDGVNRFDQCRVPLAVSAFDVFRPKTRTLAEGDLAPALRATCTFPGLFSPVWHPRGVLIDGGVSDTTGMWSVPYGKEDCRRVLNVTFGYKGDDKACVSPSRFPTGATPRPEVEIATLVLTGLPRPNPFAMERGVDALEAARSQVAAVLDLPLLTGKERSHWIVPLQPSKLQTPVSDTSRVSNKRGPRERGAGQGDSVSGGGAAEALRGGEKRIGMDDDVVRRPGPGRPQILPKALHPRKRRRTGLWSCPDEEGKSSEEGSSKSFSALGCKGATIGLESVKLAKNKAALCEEMPAAQQGLRGTVAVAEENSSTSDIVPGPAASTVSPTSGSDADHGDLADDAVCESGGIKIEIIPLRKSCRTHKPNIKYSD